MTELSSQLSAFILPDPLSLWYTDPMMLLEGTWANAKLAANHTAYLSHAPCLEGCQKMTEGKEGNPGAHVTINYRAPVVDRF
jgi:hypothetical protein